MDFKEKVQSMSSDEIIMAMVEGIRNPQVNLDMGTFGDVVTTSSFFGLFKKETCYGCAATNTICQISGVKLNTQTIDSDWKRSKAVNSPTSFLRYFEYAINELRKGRVGLYNNYARDLGFARIKTRDISLPLLDNDFTESDLNKYIALAQAEREILSEPNE